MWHRKYKLFLQGQISSLVQYHGMALSQCNFLFIIHSTKLEHPMFSPLRGGHKDEQGSVILSRSALSSLTFTILYALIPAWQLRKLGLNCGQEHRIPALVL